MSTRCSKKLRKSDIDDKVLKRLHTSMESPNLNPNEESPNPLANIDVSNISDLDEDDIIWHCPRKADTDHIGATPRCRMHALDATGEDIVEEYHESLNQEPESLLAVDASDPDTQAQYAEQIVGVDVDKIDISKLAERVGKFTLDLTLSSIGKLIAGNSTLNQGLRINACQLGSVDISQFEIKGPLHCQATIINDEFIASQVQIRESLYASGSLFREKVDLDSATVSRSLHLVNTIFHSSLNLDESQIQGTLRFNGGEIDHSLSAVKTEISELLWLRGCEIGWNLDCQGAEIKGQHPMGNITAIQLNEASMGGEINLVDVKSNGSLLGTNLNVTANFLLENANIQQSVWLGSFDSDTADLEQATIGGSLRAANANIGDELDLTSSENGTYSGTAVDGAIHLRHAKVGTLLLGPEQTTCPMVDARDTELETLKIDKEEKSENVLYDFTDAEIQEVVFENDDIRIGGDVRFLDTTFGLFDSTRERQLLDSDAWQIHSTDDPATLSQGRHFSDVENLGIDLISICICNEFSDFTQELVSDGSIDPEELLNHVFQSKADEEEAGVDGPMMEYIPDIIQDRERLRRGFLTRLAEHVHRSEHRRGVIEILKNPECREEVRNLASIAVRNREQSPERVITKAETVEALGNFTSVVSNAVADPKDVEPSQEDIESTYLKARKGADNAGDTVAAGEFYVRELEARRCLHKQRLVKDDDTFGPLKDYISNSALWVLAGYGERPSHVFLSSVVLIFLFAGLYAGTAVWTGALENGIYQGVTGYFLLSFESFIAFVLGGAAVESRPIRLLADIQGFIGAFIIGLFVFTLTRSINR